MKHVAAFLCLCLSTFAFSQSDHFPDLLIRYAKDRSIALVGYSEGNFDSNSLLNLDDQSCVDTLIKQYKIEAMFFPDSTYFGQVENHIALDSAAFSDLIIRSGLLLNMVKYGVGGARNCDELTEKYGVRFSAGGCIVDPTDFEREYYRFQRQLLNIRNGINWDERYYHDVKHLNKH